MSSEAAGLTGLIVRDHRHLDDLLGRCLSVFASQDVTLAADAMMAFDSELRRHTTAEDEHLFARLPKGKLVPGTDESEPERLRRELSLEHVQVRELSGMLVRMLTERRDLHSVNALFPSLLRRWDAHTSREESALLDLIPEGDDLGAFFLPGWLGWP